VVYDDPVANNVPVVDESANQLNVVLAGGIALKVTVPSPQFAPLNKAPTAVGNAFNIADKWSESSKTKVKKIFFIKQQSIDKGTLPLASCFSSISVSERLFLANFSKTLSQDDIVVDVDSGMGGISAILAHNNSTVHIYSVGSFNGNGLYDEFNNSTSYVQEQLFDVCREVNESTDVAETYLAGIYSDFKNDPSGFLVWKRNTEKFKNIKLLQEEWSSPVDLCIIKHPSIDNLTKWIPYVKENKYIAVHTYNIGDISKEYINTKCKLIKTVDNMMLFQKL
jgi:hypothetical protein